MKKSSLFIRYMKFWYGIEGPLDEYKRTQMERIGNNAFFLTWIPMNFFFLLSMALNSFFNSKVAYLTMMFGWAATLCVFSGYTNHEIKKYGLNTNEVEEKDLVQAKKRARIRGWISGLLFGFLGTIVLSWNNDSKLFSWASLIVFVLGTVFFGLFASIMFSSRIKVIKE
ncbi:DUF3278 domain-containing protein [uncultured Lactobacillus sp.]|uniref:DUF3278 domain-containing protein n=1 Tax=uncultured Lactobacillus sp. TaxID=153152 RepID=UPI0026045E1E|nr:DUF3278 domain-containing protein [uncultured Lactobacillus sp.]